MQVGAFLLVILFVNDYLSSCQLKLPTMGKIVVFQLLNLNIMPQTKEQKQKTAKNLIEQRAQLTAQQQITKLDNKFGVGVGAKKERARLMKML